jgi:hypothetical protein
VVRSIDPHDDATIDAHDVTALGVSYATNERLYLCHLLGKNVDPDKDILFNRPLRDEYRTYIDIATARTAEQRERLRRRYGP